MSLTLLNIDEVASLLRLSRDTVYRLAASGKLPGKKVGRAWRFAEEEIEEYVAREFVSRGKADQTRKDLRDIEVNLSKELNDRDVLIRQTNAQLEKEVADRKRIESYLRAIFETINDGLIIAGRDGNFVHFNRAAEEILGMGMTESQPEAWADHCDVFLDEGRTICPTNRLPLTRALQGEVVEHQELYIKNAILDAPIWVVVRSAPILDEAGNIDGGVVIFHDITDLKQAAKDYDLNVQRLEKLIDLIPSKCFTDNRVEESSSPVEGALVS